MKSSLPSVPVIATSVPEAVAPAASSTHFPLPGWPLFRLGFRPFYLGAAAFALFAVPYWIAGLLGWLALPSTMPPLWWHAHEMLYGFAVAVIVGFLLTAGKAWTGLATPRGATLAAMAGLWLAARLSALGAPYAVHAVLDAALLPWVAFVLIRVLLKAGNRRNLPLGAILLLLATANLGFHAAVMGWLDLDPLRALHAGLALIVMIECVIAGRVIPAFTMSALPGRQLKVPTWLERSTLAVTALSLASWVLLPANPVTAVGFAAAALSACRPVVALAALAHPWAPDPVGAARGVCLVARRLLAAGLGAGRWPGRFCRYSRPGGGRHGRAHRRHGHPHRERPHRPPAEGVASGGGTAYLLVAVAAVARVLLPLFAPAHTAHWLVLAAAAWAVAFALYLWVFTPWLLEQSSRRQGRLRRFCPLIAPSSRMSRGQVRTSLLKGSHDCNADSTHLRARPADHPAA
jgi:uncharacterized protein involved in response to NO